jgi:sec-independent protein translocase protein TatB
MFDIGFSEMMIVAVVALVVLGPERLPRVARQAGQWLGKLQRYVSDVKSDINRQMELEELRKLQSEVKDAASNLEKSFKSSVAEAQSDFNEISASLQGESSSGPAEPTTDWDKVYAVRRTRERVLERRQERAKALGHKQPKRRR